MLAPSQLLTPHTLHLHNVAYSKRHNPKHFSAKCVWVRHILRLVAAELTVKTACIIFGHGGTVNPTVTCRLIVCSADTNHMAWLREEKI